MQNLDVNSHIIKLSNVNIPLPYIVWIQNRETKDSTLIGAVKHFGNVQDLVMYYWDEGVDIFVAAMDKNEIFFWGYAFEADLPDGRMLFAWRYPF